MRFAVLHSRRREPASGTTALGETVGEQDRKCMRAHLPCLNSSEIVFPGAFVTRTSSRSIVIRQTSN
jgi:hypothetical protein